MNKRFTYTFSAIVAIALLSGFSSKIYFPAPLEEPVAAFYMNLSSSGIYDNNSNTQTACERIANTVDNICNYRNPQNKISNNYKNLSLSFLKESIIDGFLNIKEFYFYYKTPDEYALIANGNFDIKEFADKTKSEKIYNSENDLIAIKSIINQENQINKSNLRMVLNANKNTIVICPENISSNIMENLKTNQNQLSEDFVTFEKMVQKKPALSAEIKIEKMFNESSDANLPKSVSATKLVRLLVASKQNKIQLSVPQESDRELLKEELLKQTSILNSIFENQTDYQLTEGKTSLFIETKANKEQMQVISQKAMAFMLHFFIKKIPSDQL